MVSIPTASQLMASVIKAKSEAERYSGAGVGVPVGALVVGATDGATVG